MPTSRKLRRRKEIKERKDLKRKAKKASREVSEAVSKMPTSCCKCGKAFDKEDKHMIESWMINVYSDGTSTLTCDKCHTGS